ncbi:hypothetical protein BJY00DRAFT_318806 [Aspergillus carlsbadensis]|nr:hypothetical protein BJY00DRAFT_318806 [Aspergillus carlsbadensis]
MRSLNIMLAIWIALLAVFSMALPVDDAANTDLTNVTTTADDQFPIALLDLPDSADLLARYSGRPDPDVTCNPMGYGRERDSNYEDGINSFKDQKGTLTLYGQKCKRLACQDRAAVYVCNLNKGRLFLTYKEIATSAWGLYNTCSDAVIHFFSGIHHQRHNWRTVMKADDYRCPYPHPLPSNSSLTVFYLVFFSQTFLPPLYSFQKPTTPPNTVITSKMQFNRRAIQMSWRSLQERWRSFQFSCQSLPKVAMVLFSIAILGSIGAVLSKVLAPPPDEGPVSPDFTINATVNDSGVFFPSGGYNESNITIPIDD